MKSFFINIGVILVFIYINANIASSNEDMLQLKLDWEQCCENNVCIEKSCYFLIQKASNWATIRQRCLGEFIDYVPLVDLVQIRHENDLQILSDLILQLYNKNSNGKAVSTQLWTGGLRCPSNRKKKLTEPKWISSNEPFPEWLNSKLSSLSKKIDECEFLVYTPAATIAEMEYEFQDQESSHAGLCEFILPPDIPLILSTKTLPDIPISTLSSETEVHETYDTYDETEQSTVYLTSHLTNWTNDEIEDLQNQSTRKATGGAVLSTTVKKMLKTSQSPKIESTKAYEFCKGKKEAGIKWPDTFPGITVNMSCPKGMTGYAQWTCSEFTLKFIPEKPHIQECKHIWINDLEEHVRNGKDAVTISSELAKGTKNKNLSHGDITALVDLSVKILNLFSVQNEEHILEVGSEPKPYVFTGSMVASMSNILRAEIKEAWKVLPQSHQVRAASKILQIVTTIGSRLSCIKKSKRKLQFTIASENIGLQTFILNHEQHDINDPIVFPQKVLGVEEKSSLIIPPNLTWKRGFKLCTNYDTAVGVIYKHVGDFLKTDTVSNSRIKVVTKVISFSMNNNSKSILLPNDKWVTIILRHQLQKNINHEHLRCMFWNFSKQTYGQWDDAGCYRVSSNETHVICSCNHLTNFAVLMDVNNNVEENDILSIMTYVCCGMSSITLIITLFCFLSIRSLHGRRSIITGNLCLSLLITNLLIIFGLDQTRDKILCAIIAGFLHFWILSAFCWMLVEGYHLYKMVVLVFERGHIISVKAYYMFAYGVPSIVVCISASIRTDDYGGELYCWLSSSNGLMWSFVGPACGIILVNIVIFVLTLRSASTVKIKQEQTTLKKIKNWARGSMSVMCLLGLTWCLGLFYIDKKLSIFSYVFTILNGMQGVFIFFFHILLNEKVSSFFSCNRNKKNRWKKCYPQTSSNQLHSKLSSNTSVNSIGCVSYGVSVLGPKRLPHLTFHQNSFDQDNNRSKYRSKKNLNCEMKTICEKENARHTVSENGLRNISYPRIYKMRSQSSPEQIETEMFHQGALYFNKNFSRH